MGLEKGYVLDGQYEIIREIGHGGMSVVYLAMDNRQNKQWAVKVVQRYGKGPNQETIINKPTDAEVMKKLEHPAIPRIKDIIDNPDDSQIYIVMDYIEGDDLSKVVGEFGAQPEELVIEWGKQICDVLMYLHSQKPPIIYRDMKPSNIRLKPDGNLKLYDFGIAREYKEKNLADTNILGTRGYAPPEQYGSSQTDERSDIYSFGMTLHHLVTGVDPRIDDRKLSIREFNPDLSEGLDQIIKKCTHDDREQRYQTAAELMYDLEHYKEKSKDFKKKQKKTLITFIASVGLALVFLLLGLFCRLMIGNQYEVKLKANGSVDQKIASYYEAIAINKNDTRAYSLLLDAYVEKGFDDTSNKLFSAAFNSANFDTTSADYYNLLYKIGTVYLEEYKCDSFRERITLAGPFFKMYSEGKQYSEALPEYHAASNYYTIYSFYNEFVLNPSKKEITKEKYDELINAFYIGLNDADEYKGEDAPYIRLQFYSEIMNYIYSSRKSLAVCKVDQENVLTLLKTVYDKANSTVTSANEAITLKQQILDNYDSYVSTITATYTNAGKER